MAGRLLGDPILRAPWLYARCAGRCSGIIADVLGCARASDRDFGRSGLENALASRRREPVSGARRRARSADPQFLVAEADRQKIRGRAVPAVVGTIVIVAAWGGRRLAVVAPSGRICRG